MQNSKLLTAGLLALGLASAAPAGDIHLFVIFGKGKTFNVDKDHGKAGAQLRRELEKYNEGRDPEVDSDGYIEEESLSWTYVRKLTYLITHPSFRPELHEARTLGGLDEDVVIQLYVRGPMHISPHHTTEVPGLPHAINVSIPFFARHPMQMKQLQETLVHEMAHAGDNGIHACPKFDYGADGGHHGIDIISAAAAMAEGWAYFVAARKYEAGPFTPEVRRTFLPKIVFKAAAGPKLLPRQAWTVADAISVELLVAKVLYQIWRYEGEDMTAIAAAFQASGTSGARTLADFLAAYTGSDTDRQAWVLGTIQDAIGGEDREWEFSDSALIDLMDGKLPKFRGVTIQRNTIHRTGIEAGESSADQMEDRIVEAGEEMAFSDEALDSALPGGMAILGQGGAE